MVNGKLPGFQSDSDTYKLFHLEQVSLCLSFLLSEIIPMIVLNMLIHVKYVSVWSACNKYFIGIY